MCEKLNKFLDGIKNVFMSNRVKNENSNEKLVCIGIDIAKSNDITAMSNGNHITVIVNNNDNKYKKTKSMIEVDRLFNIMTRVKKHRVKKKIAKRIKKIRN